MKNLNKDAIELRSRLLTNEAYMRAAEVEQKANRETIIRLAAEAEKEKQMASQNISDIQMLRLVGLLSLPLKDGATFVVKMSTQ